jgi:Flp pilus assembly protein TadD
MNSNPLPEAEIVEQATLDFTLGEEEKAISALREALSFYPESFAIHHALAEVHFSLRQLDDALRHAEKAGDIQPGDIHIHTSLSRIWMERGDKEKAESFGAKARMLGWKEQLKEDPEASTGPE